MTYLGFTARATWNRRWIWWRLEGGHPEWYCGHRGPSVLCFKQV